MTSRPLFGGQRAWREEEWTSSDDSVRGGSSKSALTIAPTLDSVSFHGLLDTDTLGGAGFASQRTTATEQVWDLSAFDALEVALGAGDGRRYTLNLKTHLPGKREDGRETSGVEYAYTFTAAKEGMIVVPWEAFVPFYRGREAPSAAPLDPTCIRRWSIMIRSFFDQQHGHFKVVVRGIRAVKTRKSRKPRTSRECMCLVS